MNAETAPRCCTSHADWKRMYESAIKAAEASSKTSDNLRDLLDRLAPDWRSPDAPGRKHRPVDQAYPPAKRGEA